MGGCSERLWAKQLKQSLENDMTIPLEFANEEMISYLATQIYNICTNISAERNISRGAAVLYLARQCAIHPTMLRKYLKGSTKTLFTKGKFALAIMQKNYGLDTSKLFKDPHKWAAYLMIEFDAGNPPIHHLHHSYHSNHS